MARQELPGRDSLCERGGTLADAYFCVLCRPAASEAGMDNDRSCASVSAQTVLGGVLGGNSAFYTMITSITGLLVAVQSIKRIGR